MQQFSVLSALILLQVTRYLANNALFITECILQASDYWSHPIHFSFPDEHFDIQQNAAKQSFIRSE